MDIVLRSLVAYVFIITLLRVTGRRELSSMGPTDLVLLVVIGDLIQNGVTQSDMSVTGITIALLSVASSYLVFKSRRAQRIIQGTPLIVVQDGKPVEANLRNERMTIEDLMEEARAQQVERLDQIKWAVLEANGTVSIIKSES
jgi:uncharacterized membrane protein YcaP (DUF421 family)